MKYYKTPDGQLWAFEADGSQDSFITEDMEPLTLQQYEAALVALRTPSPELVVASMTAQIQARLDAFAKTRGYDGIQSACSYVLSSVDKFQDEGTYAMQARDATWSAAYAILAQVQAGTRPVPTSLEDIEGDLPALEWPQ